MYVGTWWAVGESVHGELITQVMENVVGGRGETAGVGEGKVGSNEKVRDVLGGDVAGDLLMAAGGAGVFEDSFGVSRVDPDEFEDGLTEGRVGGTKVGKVDVGFSGGGNARQIERGGVITGAADGDDSVGF